MMESQKHIQLQWRRREVVTENFSLEKHWNNLRQFDEDTKKLLTEQLSKLDLLTTQSNPYQVLSIFAYYDRLFWDSYKKQKEVDITH